VSSVDERILGLLKDARHQLELERARRDAPIAIVGMGCRFPGGASSPEAFWKLLCDGIDATGDMPSSRWDVDRFFDVDPDAPGKYYVKRGAFLDDIAGFEPEFFSISPREAVGMDPQQRLLLEVTWEALEDYGVLPEQLRRSKTGVWVGLCLDDYARRSVMSGDPELIDAQNALGNVRSIAAGRIAYVLDLHGPAIQIDTSCPSSLVAVHQACQSLRVGECDLALAAGVSLMSAPEASIALSKLRSLSRDGHCRTFDASADGYARGEGCGVVVLKRLADAQAAGDTIHAVIRGTAVNHGGRGNGLTAPSRLAQESVIRAALGNANVSAADVGYVEAHGTGTLLGDSMEALALGHAYGENRPADFPLNVASVKTNLGHLEAASGIAALIKVALCVTHAQIPAHLHLERPNPNIPWDELPIVVPRALTPWPNDRTRIAGINSFGISGTNAHVIVEEAPTADHQDSPASRSVELVMLSARTSESLVEAARQLHGHLQRHPEFSLRDVARSLVTTRSLMEHRSGFIVTTREALLDALLRAPESSSCAGKAVQSSGRQLGWSFTGSGGQYLGMGRGLHAEWPVFRDALELAFSALGRYLDCPLADVLWAPPGSARAALLEDSTYHVPALFAFEWASSALWRSFGLAPRWVRGQGVGEIAAACVAGILSLEDAARLACARGRLSLAAATRSGAASREPEHELVRVAEALVYGAPSIPFVSELSGTIAGAEIRTASYWSRSLAALAASEENLPVALPEGVQTQLQIGPSRIGSKPFGSPEALLLGVSTRRDASESEATLQALGQWSVHGGAVDWAGVFGSQGRRVRLPTYAWKRRRYWLESPTWPGSQQGARIAVQATQLAVEQGTLVHDLLCLSTSARAAALIQLVQGEVAHVLSLSEGTSVALDKQLSELGLDSLLAVELRERLAHRLRLSLPITLGIDSALSTPGLISRRLLSLLSRIESGQADSSDFEADALLDPKLPASFARALPAHEPSQALLTGATGFLGAFILSELLQQTSANVTCLVRASDAAAGAARVANNLRQYGLMDEAFGSRVSVVIGDLDQPNLGLTRQVFEQLSESVDAVYNNAAHVSYVAAYEDLKPSHVGATGELLRLAASGRPKAIHHISSVAAYESPEYRDRTLEESMAPETGRGILLPYAQCKWVTEALIRAAAARGMPVTIHRPAFIGGSSLTGAWNSGDFLCRLLRAVIELERIPDLDIELDFSPVDYVSRSIVHLSRQAAAIGQAFNLQHPRGLQLSALAEILGSFGYQVRPIPYTEWLQHLRASPEGPLYPLVPFLEQRWPPEQLTYVELSQRRYRPHLTCHETSRLLGASNIHCPPLDRALVGRYLAFLARGGFIASSPSA
jgi:thioester reductase-like protein